MASSTKSLLAILFLCLTMASTSIAQYNLPWPSVPNEPLPIGQADPFTPTAPVQSQHQSAPAPTKMTCDQTIDTINKCANIATSNGRRRLMSAEAFTFISTPQCCQAVSDFYFKCLSKHRDAFPSDFNTFSSRMCFGTPVPPTPVETQPAPQTPVHSQPAPKTPAPKSPAPKTPAPKSPAPTKSTCDQTIDTINKCANIATSNGKRRLMSSEAFTFISTPQCCQAVSDFYFKCLSKHRDAFPPDFNTFSSTMCFGTPVPPTPVDTQPAPKTPAPTRPAPQTPVPSRPAPQTPVPSRPAPQTPVPTQPAICCPDVVRAMNNPRCLAFPTPQDRDCCCKALYDFDSYCYQFYPNQFAPQFLQNAYQVCWPQMPVQPQPVPQIPVQPQPVPQIPLLPFSDPVITQCQQAIAYVKNAQCSSMQEVHGRRLLSFSASSWGFRASPDCCKAINDYNYLCRSFFPNAFPENFLYSATMSCQ